MKLSKMRLHYDLAKYGVENADFKSADKKILANIVFQVFLIREFEETLLRLAANDCIHGPVHTSIGEEGCAAGAMAALEPADKITSTHRAHHHYLAKVISYYAARGFSALDGDIPDVIRQEVTTLMGEIMGLAIGCCGGRGGSMHLRNEKIGVIGTNAIVAGGVPLATGAAFALKHNKQPNVIVCFLGDGAVNQGAFHEAVNLAAIWKLPIIYFIENNLYAVGTASEYASSTKDLVDRAAGYGVKGRIVDGMQPLAVMLAVDDAAKQVREGKGPYIIEAKCYRFLHHAGPAAGSTYGYRTKEEEQRCQKGDPHCVFPQELVKYHILNEENVEAIRSKAIEVVNEAKDYCTTVQDGKMTPREELWPKAESIEVGIRSDGSEFADVKFNEIEDFTERETISYVDAIASVTGRHLEKDESVFVLGEEVANFGGGPYGATKGLAAKYPERVLNTPISESGFTGLAGGAAMSGLKPVVEIMFPDFSFVAADQLFNQIGKLRHMYGNTTAMPVVVRTRIAIGCGYGGQHSMDPTALFALFSGWRIVAPSNAFDYIGLFNSAMLTQDPVLVMEHHSLYPVKSEVPTGNLDFYVPFGKARVVTHGDDATILCYSSMVHMVKQAAGELAEEGIDVTVIDLRTLNLANVDYATIGNSLKETGALVVVEQAPASNSIGARIAHECERRFFDWLDSPALTITGTDIPNPVSKRLERAALPNVEIIKNAVRNAAKRQL